MGIYTGLVGDLHRQLCPTLGILTSCLCKSPIIPYLPRTGGVGRDIDKRITLESIRSIYTRFKLGWLILDSIQKAMVRFLECMRWSSDHPMFANT